MTSLVLHNRQAPGDALMLSCAVRDLHRQYPGEFQTHVVTPFPDIFRNNPNIASTTIQTVPARVIGYSESIRQANQRVGHFCSGFVQHLSELLGKRIRLTDMFADIHLTDQEKDPGQCIVKPPYWLVMAGGKRDFTAKIWHPSNWQKVVDGVYGDIPVVQVGRTEHRHAPLQNTVNLLDKTSLRQLLVLAYHATGATCHVTCLMHIMAAFNKPCVIIAGGREPWWWEAYNETTWRQNATNPLPEDYVNHAYLHTIGQLDCCLKNGCWMTGVGEKLSKNCRKVDIVGSGRQPACLSLITPEAVIAHTQNYLVGVNPEPPQEPKGLGPALWNLPLKPPAVPVPVIARKTVTPVPRRPAVSVQTRQPVVNKVVLPVRCWGKAV